MSVGFLLSSPDDAVIWRGPKKNGKSLPPSEQGPSFSLHSNTDKLSIDIHTHMCTRAHSHIQV